MAELVYARPYYYSAHHAVSRIIDIVVGVIELVLAARFVLELLDANPGSAFVAWLYGASAGLAAPFYGAFPTIMLGGGYALDLSTAFAMIVYVLFGWFVSWLASLIFNSLG